MAISLVDDINFKLLSLLSLDTLMDYRLVHKKGYELVQIVAKQILCDQYQLEYIPKLCTPLQWYKYVVDNHHCYNLVVIFGTKYESVYTDDVLKLYIHLDTMAVKWGYATFDNLRETCAASSYLIVTLKKFPIDPRMEQSVFIRPLIDNMSLVEFFSNCSRGIITTDIYNVTYCPDARGDLLFKVVSEREIQYFIDLKKQRRYTIIDKIKLI